MIIFSITKNLELVHLVIGSQTGCRKNIINELRNGLEQFLNNC